MEFRFQKLDIWKDALVISRKSLPLIEDLRTLKHYSLADQYLRATLSISNNIAEGSGSSTKRDFANFLNIARRSVFECANMIILMHEFGYLDPGQRDQFLADYQDLSARIYYFRRSLLAQL